MIHEDVVYPTAGWDGTPFKFEAWAPEGTPEYERQLANVISTGKLTFAELRALRGENPDGTPLRKKRKPSDAWVIPKEQQFWVRSDEQQAYLDSLPRWVYCGEVKNRTVRARREVAIDFPYLQHNAGWAFRYLTIDMDYAGSVAACLGGKTSKPNFICETPNNGHSHATFGLLDLVSAFNPREAGRLVAIERAITRRLQGDISFSIKGITKNPFSPVWNVERPRLEFYSLDELSQSLSAKEMKPWSKKEKRTGFGRHMTIFDEGGEYARRVVLDWKSSDREYFEFAAHISQFCFDINESGRFMMPLPKQEVHEVIASVAGWTWMTFSQDGLRRWHSIRGKARARKMWEGHVTMAQRAAELCISESTLRRRLRKQEGSNTVSSPNIAILSHSSLTRKPWEQAGIPRATWYRQQAKGR